METEMKKLLADAGQIYEEMKTEAEKFLDKGNKSAGTRVRKHALILSKVMKDIRKKVSDIKNQ